MAQSILTIVNGMKTETANLGVMKAGDTGVGDIGMGNLTATSVAVSGGATGPNKMWVASNYLFINAGTNGLVLNRSDNSVNDLVINSTGAAAFAGAVSATSITVSGGATAPNRMWLTSNYMILNVGSNGFILRSSNNATDFLAINSVGAAAFIGAVTSTTHKVTSAGGYISSDGSTGYTGTVTRKCA